MKCIMILLTILIIIQLKLALEYVILAEKKTGLLKNHRKPKGVFSNGKLISQNNKIAYLGDRFPNENASSDIIKIGYETSEKYI